MGCIAAPGIALGIILPLIQFYFTSRGSLTIASFATLPMLWLLATIAAAAFFATVRSKLSVRPDGATLVTTSLYGSRTWELDTEDMIEIRIGGLGLQIEGWPHTLNVSCDLRPKQIAWLVDRFHYELTKDAFDPLPDQNAPKATL
jgi:hypothetical protein